MWAGFGIFATVVAALAAGPATTSSARLARPATATTAPVPGSGTAHPRLVLAASDAPALRERLSREPYRTVFLQMHSRTQSYLGRDIGDFSIAAQRDLSRAAKNLAFEVLLDRTVEGDSIVPFASDADRAAAASRVRDLLLALYPRSRLAVAAPLGGYDRDINTSEEIVNYATAFDLLVGAGYDLGADRPTIVEQLSSVVRELYLNFTAPETAGGAADLMQNNHRSKSGAAMALAAIVLEGEVPDDVSRAWFDYGVLQVDDILRFMLVTGDGAYGEGPYYYRYTTQNLAPLVYAWERHLGSSPWTTQSGEVIPAPGRSALYERTQRWMLDTTLPDGTMAPIDDANPGRSHYFGLVPTWLPDARAAYWRWAGTPQAYETDGSIDLAADTIAAYDDTIAPRPPDWAPTQFYVEGGNAIFRSAWADDAVVAIALGEHDAASEFGRDRTGAGRWPQSHEHPDPGSFMFNAFGERLALDPGYLTFTTHGLVNKPEHHNIVLVDGEGPGDYLLASLRWGLDTAGRPPADGQATISDTIDSDIVDAATVSTRYGTPTDRAAEIHRRFLFADDRYLVVSDAIAGPADPAATYTWLVHGNGGGSSGGSFTTGPAGGRWEIGGARLDAGVAVDSAVPALSTREAVHEVPYGQQRTHTALAASASGTDPRSVLMLYPTEAGVTAPTIEQGSVPGAASLSLTDVTDDRRVVVTRRSAGAGGPLSVGRFTTDGELLLVDTHLDGTLRLVWADGARWISQGSVDLLRTTDPGSLGLRFTADAASVVAGGSGSTVTVRGLPFTPGSADGACAFGPSPWGGTRLRLGRDRRVTLRAAAGNGSPAADPGADTRVAAGTEVTLDGTGSCDPDGDALTPSWELVSAPAGSEWSLDGAGTWNPALLADRAGPYRVRLTVTDPNGATSRESEVLVKAGPRGADGVDDDLDGLIDSDDPDLDGPEPAPPRDLVLALFGDPPSHASGGYTGTESFTVTRDASGRVRSVDGHAHLDGGAAMTLRVRTRDGRASGWVRVRDPALGSRTVTVPIQRDALFEFAPGVIGGRVDRLGHAPFAWLLVDH